MFLALAAIDRRRGRIERAKAIHRTVLASSELPAEQRVAALLGLGRDLLAAGNERAAVGALVRAIGLSPRSTATLESLARALEEARAWERAAAAWERLEKQVDGRRARDARIGRGHALAGQALEVAEEGEDRKARKLVDRAVELAPDSAHVWTAKARVESRAGDTREAPVSWQRAWELCPAGASGIVAEAWVWAQERGVIDELVERMLSTLRSTEDATLIVGLADRVARRNPEQAASALQRVAPRSSDAQLALIRLRLARGQRDAARDAALEPPAARGFTCDACGTALPGFTFRCPACGSWDRVVVERTVEAGDKAERAPRRASPAATR